MTGHEKLLCKLSCPRPPNADDARGLPRRNAATRCRYFWVFLVQAAAVFLILVNPDLGSECRVSGAILNNAADYWLHLG